MFCRSRLHTVLNQEIPRCTGPTGLILAQLLKLNGAAKVTLAANKGIKMVRAGSVVSLSVER